MLLGNNASQICHQHVCTHPFLVLCLFYCFCATYLLQEGLPLTARTAHHATHFFGGDPWSKREGQGLGSATDALLLVWTLCHGRDHSLAAVLVVASA
jgi:hypothetical protein